MTRHETEIRALAEFRYQLRRFIRFSEQSAREAGLEPQQHQLLLAVIASPDARLTIGQLAERMQLLPHSTDGESEGTLDISLGPSLQLALANNLT